MVYALKTQRLTTRKPLKDRFITSQIHPSSQEKEGYAGCLFSLVEIDNNQYSSSQIGHSIINTTAREYFRLNNEDASQNFELALKKTNEILANYTQEGQTDWIGNLHGIIALIYKDEIHLTCVGKTIALLIRDGKSSAICQESSSDDIHPLCTFSNITSGKLEPGDVILFATSNLFKVFPKKELKQLIEISSLEDSSLEIAQTLAQEKITDVNLLLVETTTKENLANEPLSNIPETIYIDETNESVFSKISYATKKKILPKISKTSRAAILNLISLTKVLKRKPLNLNTTSKLGNSISDTVSSIQNLFTKTVKSKQNLNDPSYEKPIKINHYNNFKFNLKIISFYPILIFVLVVILSTSIYLKLRQPSNSTKNPTKEQSTSSTNLSNLQTKFSLAKSASPKEAIVLLNEIITSLSNKKLTIQEADLLKQSQTKLYSLTNTNLVTTPTSKIPLPPNTISFKLLDNGIYAFTKSGSIYKNTSSSKKLLPTLNLPANSGNIVSVSTITAKKTFFVYTSKQKVFEFSPKTSQIKALISAEPWKNALEISTYDANIYLLDSQGQIWKYTYQSSKDAYSIPQAYTKLSATAPTIKSITIDGSIYGLAQNGQIFKIQKTGFSPINYQKFPSANQIPDEPNYIFTDSTTNQFFIVEQNRITITDKTGTFNKELILNNPAKIEAIFVKPTLHKIWVSANSSLFTIDY